MSDALEEQHLRPRPSTQRSCLCMRSASERTDACPLATDENIVRGLVIECLEDARMCAKGGCTWGGATNDPAIRTSKMSLEDAMKISREERGSGLMVLIGLNGEGTTREIGLFQIPIPTPSRTPSQG
jgi:hypothetical protein